MCLTVHVYWYVVMEKWISALRERGEPVPPGISLEVARDIKEKYSYLASDIVKARLYMIGRDWVLRMD